MNSTYRYLTLFAICMGSSALAFPAQGQNVPEEEEYVINVNQQRLPEYEAQGIQWGLFEFKPSIALEETFDDNIYRTETDEESDFIHHVKPAAVLQSDWANHEMQFLAFGDLAYYNDNGTEDYQDYTAQAKGQFELVYETFLHATARHSHLHEDRSSPNEVNGDAPTEIDVNTLQVGLSRELAMLKLFVDAKQQDMDFDDTFRNGVLVSNDDRNRTHREYQAKVAYEYYPNYDVFTRYTYNTRDYDNSGIVDRDSDGHQIELGTALDISGKAKGEIYAGYMTQEYDDFDDVNKVNFGGELLWNVTGLTSLNALVERSVMETIMANASSFVRTRYRVGADHAVLENLIVNGSLQYIDDNYITTSSGTGRNDDYYNAGVGMKYLLRPGLALNTAYDYVERDSTIASESYGNNVVSVSLSYAY